MGSAAAWLILKSRTISMDKYTTVNTALSVELDRTRVLSDRLSQVDTLVSEQAEKITALTAAISSKSTQFESLEKQLSEKEERFKTDLDQKKKDLAEISGILTDKFEVIASRILEDKSGKFVEANKQNLETILTPLGKEIGDFKKKVEDFYDKDSKERYSLGKEMEKLVAANQQVSEQANNLANALTSNVKVQGNWGEMILDTILERSGLIKDQHYFLQGFLKDESGNDLYNENGERMKPDALIRYPDARAVVVDSKVSLKAYNRYMNPNADDNEKELMKSHIKSVRDHIDGLSAKNYQDYSSSLDFVIMFVPVEQAYILASHADPELWQYAYQKRILLASPSTLIVALRMIKHAWTVDNQNRNYMEILERGGKLYDKFVAVIESFQEVGEKLLSAQNSYKIAMNRMSEGKDNVLKQVEKLKTLGAKTKKSLPTPDVLCLVDGSDD